MDDTGPTEVPLVERLRAIHPLTCVALERGPSETSSVPIGYLAHAAADRIEALEAEREDLHHKLLGFYALLAAGFGNLCKLKDGLRDVVEVTSKA